MDDTPDCPVQSLSFYLQKLSPNGNEFFQRPVDAKTLSIQSHDMSWYKGPMGDQVIMKMMAGISRAAHLSHIYTNTSVRATLDELLGSQGIILDVLFHQKPMQPTLEEVSERSALVHNTFYKLLGEGHGCHRL